MFRLVSVVVFVAVFAGIAADYMLSGRKSRAAGRPEKCSLVGGLLRKLVLLLVVLCPEQRLSLIQKLRKLIYLLGLFCFFVLAITGFYPMVVTGKHLSGYLMMIHATFAGVFAVCAAALVLMWAQNCRFNPSDWPWLIRLIRRVNEQTMLEEKLSPSGRLGQKVTFWMIVPLLIEVILSIVLSMFPLFGTDVQELLLDLHRYGALLLASAAIVHAYLMMRAHVKNLTVG